MIDEAGVLTSRQAYTVESPFVVRTAGLPAATLGALGSQELLSEVRATVDDGSWLAAEGSAIADELHELIGTAPPSAKPGLVGLRRALHRGRRPRAAEWNPTLAAALPAMTCERITQWLRRNDIRHERLAALPAVLERAADSTLAPLLEAVADPAFRHGLVQSSPVLSAELEKWLRRGGDRPPRRLAVRLARYLARAAAKTSPFSTFTTIGAGVWGDGPDPLVTIDRPRQGLLELYGAVLTELGQVLRACPAVRPNLVVRTNSSLTRLGDRLMAIGPPPGEDIAAVAAMPEVLRCVELLGDGWSTMAALLDALAPRTTAAAADRVTAFVDRLVELGLLELRPPVDDQDRDPFGTLATWLQACGGSRWAGTAALCDELSLLLTTPTRLDEVDGHRARLEAVSTTVASLRAEAGLAPDLVDGRELVHEHAVCTAPTAVAGRAALRGALDDLHALGRWLTLHDPGLELRLALGAYCAERFGVGASVPFVLFHRTLLGDLDGPQARGGNGSALVDLGALLRPSASAAPAERVLPVLRELAGLRSRSLGALLSRPAGPDGVVRVDPAELLAEADALPAFVRPLASLAWYVQPYGRRLVLNTAVSGHGRGRGRWLELVAAANGGELPDELRPSRSGDGGPLVADSSGTFGHPLNRRMALAGHELDYPFTVRRHRDRPGIAPRDLVVSHDPATGLALPRTRDGRAVTAVHTGMMAEFLLPMGLQLLVRGFGVTPSLVQAGVLLAPSGTPEFAPRVDVGLVTARRAAWSVPARQVPRRERGETDAAYLVRLHTFLAARGIPEVCFVRLATLPGADWARTTFTKERKPEYVDFASPWLLTTFERLLAGAQDERHVVFREALPHPARAPGPFVTELVVETTEDLP